MIEKAFSVQVRTWHIDARWEDYRSETRVDTGKEIQLLVSCQPPIRTLCLLVFVVIRYRENMVPGQPGSETQAPNCLD